MHLCGYRILFLIVVSPLLVLPLERLSPAWRRSGGWFTMAVPSRDIGIEKHLSAAPQAPVTSHFWK